VRLKNNLSIKSRLKQYEQLGFLGPELHEIENGLHSGVDVSLYAHHRFDHWQMDAIRRGLEKSVHPDQYLDVTDDADTITSLVAGFVENVDLREYAKQGFTGLQLKYILESIVNNVDVSKVAKLNYTPGVMHRVVDGLISGIDISNYADEGYGGLVLTHVLRAVTHGYDTHYLLNNDFSAKQLYLISDGLRLGLDVSQYADPNIPFTEMRMIKSKLFNDKLRGDANEIDK
jgi:hypothetical protein